MEILKKGQKDLVLLQMCYFFRDAFHLLFKLLLVFFEHFHFFFFSKEVSGATASISHVVHLQPLVSDIRYDNRETI